MTDVPIKKQEIYLDYTFIYGIDKEIQVEEDVIFNFDKEIEPLVEILKIRILEDSFVEVLRETEIERLQKKQMELKKIDEIEKLRLKNFFEKKKKNLLEKKKIQKIFKEKKFLKMKMHKKMVAREFSKKYISGLKKNFGEFLDIFDKGIKNFDFIYINDNFKYDLEKKILFEIKKKKNLEKKIKIFFEEKKNGNLAKHEKSVNYEKNRILVKKEKFEKMVKEKKLAKIQKMAKKRFLRREKKVEKMKKIFLENFKPILDIQKGVKIFEIFSLTKFNSEKYKKGGFLLGGGLFEFFLFFEFLEKLEEKNSFDFSKIFEFLENFKIKIILKFSEKIIEDFDNLEIEIEEINFGNLRKIEKNIREEIFGILVKNLISNFQEKKFCDNFLPFLLQKIFESETKLFEILIEEPKLASSEEIKNLVKIEKKNIFVILRENSEEKELENSQEIILSNFQKLEKKKIFEISDLKKIFSEKINFSEKFLNFMPNSDENFDNEFFLLNFSLNFQIKNIFCDFIENEFSKNDSENFKKNLENFSEKKNFEFLTKKKKNYPKFEFVITLI